MSESKKVKSDFDVEIQVLRTCRKQFAKLGPQAKQRTLNHLAELVLGSAESTATSYETAE